MIAGYCALQGIPRDEAGTLIEWAEEYGLRYHEPMVHTGSGWGAVVEHITIGPNPTYPSDWLGSGAS